MSVHFSSVTDNWKTPQDLYDDLDKEFGFNFDPCPLNENPDFDGLLIEWGSKTFCNPPYSKLRDWCKKAYQESVKGKTIVMLIPSRTDTRAWHDYVMKAQEIRFIKGRLRFGDAKNSAPFPSCVVIFNPKKEADDQIEAGLNERESLLKEIQALQKENELLRECVDFYADIKNWERSNHRDLLRIKKDDHSIENVDTWDLKKTTKRFNFTMNREEALVGGKRARECKSTIDRLLGGEK